MIAEYTWRGVHIYDGDKLLKITDYKFYFNSKTGSESMFELSGLNSLSKIMYSIEIKNSHEMFVDLNNFVDYCESRVKEETNKVGRCKDGYDYIIPNFYDSAGGNIHSVKEYISKYYELKDYSHGTKMMIRKDGKYW